MFKCERWGSRVWSSEMSYMKYDIVTITLLLGDGESCSHLNDAPRSCEVMSRFFLANFYVSAQNSMATFGSRYMFLWLCQPFTLCIIIINSFMPSEAKDKFYEFFKGSIFPKYCQRGLNGHTLGFHSQTQKLEPPCTA